MSRIGVVIALGLAGVLGARTSEAQTVQPVMVGRWWGQADITVSWTQQRSLAVNIVLYAGDSVTGMIGDAKIVKGHFSSNGNALIRALGWKTDYVIDAMLEGPIIISENIRRASVRMPLDWREARFEGSIQTSGTTTGSLENRVLSAKVVLHRAPDMIICEWRPGRPPC